MEGATDKKSNTEAQEDFTIGIYIYRAIRLLNDLQNITFGSFFLPFMKLALLLVLFISVYATIKLRSLMHPVVFGFFLLYTLNVLLVTLPGAVIMSKIFSCGPLCFTSKRHDYSTFFRQTAEWTRKGN